MYNLSLYCNPKIITTEKNICFITVDRDIVSYINDNDIKMTIDFDTGLTYDVPILIKEYNRERSGYDYFNITVDCTKDQYEELIKLSEDIKPCDPIKFNFYSSHIGEAFTGKFLFFSLKKFCPVICDHKGKIVTLAPISDTEMSLFKKELNEEEFFVIVQKRYERQVLKIKLS